MAAGAKRKTGTEPAAIHQLKVTLQGIRPPIWRRLQVRSDTTLARLHAILQVAMGWEEEHLHQFRVGETVYGDREILQEFDVRSERTARLGQVVPEPKDRFFYDYDFGDSWST